MLRHNTHHDHPSRYMGLLAFLCGIAMLGAVFVIAYHLFTHPVPGLDLTTPPHGTPPPAANIGASLAGFFEKLLLLALLTVVGSVVASRGVHLCYSAHGPRAQHEETAQTADASGTAPLSVVTSPDKNPIEKRGNTGS